MVKRIKHTAVYRIYRRLRYLRYVKKLRGQERKHIEESERKQDLERNRIIKEQRKSEKHTDQHKRRQERQEARAAFKEIKKQVELSADEQEEELATRKAIESRERRHKQRRRKRLLRFYLKACRRNSIATIKLFNPARLPLLFRYISDNRRQTREFAIIVIHSTLLYVAAYFIVFLIGLLVSAISGLFFEYKSIIYYYEVLWLVKPSQWFGDSVKMIYASPAIVAGILAIFLAIIFSYIRTDKGLLKLFVLWNVLHGFNGFFGSLLIGSLFGRGLGYAIIWSYVSDTSKVVYSIIALTALIVLGFLTTKSFLISANSYYPKLESRNHRSFIWAQVILPFLLGNAAIGLVMFPRILAYNMTVSLSLALCIIPIAIGYRFYPSLYFEEETIRIKLKYRIILLTISFIALYRIVLGIGIPLG